MVEYDSISSSVLEKICPSEKECIDNSSMFENIRKHIKEKYSLDARLMGSVAKDTFLAGDKDLDIFVVFPTTTRKEALEEKGLLIGKSVFKNFGGEYVVSYAEHPYTKGKIGNFDVEIVPAYSIKSAGKIISAVDRTPFHTDYVLEKLKKPDEVRLFKKFLKGLGLYGSDLKTNGFSGYLCEILIIRYGTFINVLKKSQSWKYQKIIDMENGYKKKDKKDLREKFKDQPFIFLDPIDRNRNVAAVLSKENLAKFIYYAGRYLESPSMNYFYPVKRNIDKHEVLRSIRQRGTVSVAICFDRPDTIDDILYPQMRRLHRRIEDYLSDEGFVIVSSSLFSDNDCGIYLELISATVPRFKKRVGPRIFDPKKNRDNFIKKYKDFWFEGDRMVSEVRRRNFDLESSVYSLFEESDVSIIDKGIPKGLAPSIRKGYSISEGKDLLKIDSDEFWYCLDRKKRIFL